MALENARFNPAGYPWYIKGFDFAWVMIVPGGWDSDHKNIWVQSEFAPIYDWLIANAYGRVILEVNSSDGVMTPVEVHFKDASIARWFALLWT